MHGPRTRNVFSADRNICKHAHYEYILHHNYINILNVENNAATPVNMDTLPQSSLNLLTEGHIFLTGIVIHLVLMYDL